MLPKFSQEAKERIPFRLKLLSVRCKQSLMETTTAEMSAHVWKSQRGQLLCWYGGHEQKIWLR